MLDTIRSSINIKLLLAMILGSIVIAAISAVMLQRIKQQNTELVGVTTADQVAGEIFAFRNLYSSELLPRAKSHGAQATYDFEATDDMLPFPATLVKTMGSQIQETNPGTTVRYYSEFPFAPRVGTAEAELDEFDHAALNAFEENPHEPYYRLEERGDSLVMRYVVADVMQEGCVECHNSHPDSLKQDWEVGEVRGGLEIVIPVDEAEIGLNNGTILLTTLVICGLASISLFTWYIMQHNVLRPLTATSRAMATVQEGDFSVRAPVYSNDEMGVLATRVNKMIETTGEIVSSAEKERDDLQSSVFTLLSEVSGVAEGDLTANAEVSDGALGAVADSFNYMISQLRTIINDVQDATLQVSSSANEVQTTAEHLTMGSESQAAQILDTSAAIDEMTVSIQQVSENAALSATVGEQARANAEKGAEAVRDTIEGMDRIRGQVQDTSKRIKRLGDSSQRIGEIVNLIDDIADRTSILALNASIQAELAGDAGRSFAVVAEEVESLAERSTQATQQIGILIRNIQSEINEAIAAMESTSDETIIGAEIANEAGQRLHEIETVSDKLSELINSISLAAKQQARGSETIARSMTEIAEVTQQTAAGTREATSSIGNLAVLADDLRSSVSAFKLPNEEQNDDEYEAHLN